MSFVGLFSSLFVVIDWGTGLRGRGFDQGYTCYNGEREVTIRIYI